MIRFAIAFLICMVATSHADTAQQKAVKAYYSGFETHNWDLVANQLATGFTFTTQVDDHISAKEFKDVCWGTNKFVKKVSLIEMEQTGDQVMLLVEIHTTDDKLVRNVDIYKFDGAKIKSVEVFFGRGASFPGNKS